MPPVEILIEGLTQSCILMTMAFGMVLVYSILGILNCSGHTIPYRHPFSGSRDGGDRYLD